MEGGLLGAVVFLQGLLQFVCHLLVEADLLLQEVLHLGLEVAHADLVEVLDLRQCAEGDDVAALADALRLLRLHLPLLHMLLALLHFGEGSCKHKGTSQLDRQSLEASHLHCNCTGYTLLTVYVVQSYTAVLTLHASGPTVNTTRMHCNSNR